MDLVEDGADRRWLPGNPALDVVREEDFADLVAASPALGFLPKFALSPAAVTALLESR